MQPLPPRLRTALERAHPGLNDEDFDRLEVLRARSVTDQLSRDAAPAAQARSELEAFLRARMPRFADVIAREQQRFLRDAPKPRRRAPTVKGL